MNVLEMKDLVNVSRKLEIKMRKKAARQMFCVDFDCPKREELPSKMID